ncbi:MAG: ATP-binding protein [Streptosporangiaceae bacterium]
MTAAAAPPLAPDLVAGLRRLKLAAMRQLAPELLITAKTQRWAPGELLRTLIEAEISAREALNARTRMRNAAFPVIKALDELDRSACSIPGPTLDYLATLEWITARENLCLVGPAGTGKSHVLVSLGISAVHAGHKVRYFTAADLVDTLYRGLAGNSVGKVIENLLRNDLILVDLCRHRDYAEGAIVRAWWAGCLWLGLGIVTSCRGTRAPCRSGGSDRAVPGRAW